MGTSGQKQVTLTKNCNSLTTESGPFAHQYGETVYWYSFRNSVTFVWPSWTVRLHSQRSIFCYIVGFFLWHSLTIKLFIRTKLLSHFKTSRGNLTLFVKPTSLLLFDCSSHTSVLLSNMWLQDLKWSFLKVEGKLPFYDHWESTISVTCPVTLPRLPQHSLAPVSRPSFKMPVVC